MCNDFNGKQRSPVPSFTAVTQNKAQMPLLEERNFLHFALLVVNELR